MQGWIIDSYPNYDSDSMVVWLWTEHGARRIEDSRFRPSFFMSAPPGELQSYRQRLEILDEIGEVRETRRRLNLGDEEPSPVLEIFPRHYRDLNDLAKTIDSNGGYYDHRLYNIDLRFSQRYFLQHDIFPLGLVDYSHNMWRMQEEQLALEYKLPPLRAALLDIAVDAPMGIPRLQDKLLGARLCEIDIGGSEGEILEKLNAALRDLDPDVILTDGGDSFLMPYLAKKSEALGIGLQLGREPQRLDEKKGRSYFTYGRIVYKPGQYLLKGRLHIDRGHFAYRESEMAGLGELSRLSTIVPQEQARLTPGTAFTAMQINRATRDGVLVMWKKNLPEFFKDAEQLIRADRGGFILEPEVGVHENIVELDYASLYPNIMVKFNLSMETLNCGCCADGGGQPVPGLGYHSCVKRLGLVPRVLRPLIDRKRYYKKLKKEPGPKQEIYRERDTILKWTLVTSFGFQGFRNARFGRIECHESINAHARDLLVRSMEIAEQHGYEVVHGIVDSLWLRPKSNASGIDKLVEHINGAIGIPIDLEGVYKWVVFLPCKTTGVGALNCYYGLFQNGEMKLRGIELRKHDTSPFVNEAQKAMLDELSHANNAKEFVERLPRAVAVLQTFAQRLKDGKVPLQDLVLTKAVTRQLDEYTVMTSSVAALKQMKSRGYPIEPGEYIRFVITDGQSKNSEKKVKVADFIQGDEKPDVNEYLKLLCRAGETLLLPLGYTEDRLLEICRSGPPPSDPTPAENPHLKEIPRRSGPGYMPTRH